MRSRTCAEHHIRLSFTSIFASLVNGRESNHSLYQWPSQAFKSNMKIENRSGCPWSSSAGLRWKFLASRLRAKPCVYVFQAVPAWTKWRKSDHVTGRRQLNLSPSSRAVHISVAGMITTFAANNAVSTKGNLFALKTVPVSFVRIGCLRRGWRKPRPMLREIDARPQRRRKQPRKLKRPWMIPWRYTLRKRRSNFLPSVPRPRDHPRQSGWRPKPRRLKNPLSPSLWRPASRWWDGPALTGQTVAGPGVQSVSDGTGTTNVRILRDISCHSVTAPGGRASGPGQFPLAVPAPGGVPSPAVSPRRRTPVRRPLPLDIILSTPSSFFGRSSIPVIKFISGVSRLQVSAQSREKTRECRPDGSHVRRQTGCRAVPQAFPATWEENNHGGLFPGSAGSCWIGPRSSSPGPGGGRPGGGRPGGGKGTATGDGSDTGDGPATGDGPVTVDDPASDDPEDVSEVESELHFDEPDETDGPARLPAEARLGTPVATSPGDGPDVSRSTGTSSCFSLPSRDPSVKERW